MYLVKTPAIFQNLFKSVVFSKPSQDAIYLTFDDGPDPDVTPWVLGELKKYNALATFFCIGENAKKYPQLIDQIIASGHSIGNHSYSHLSGWNSSVLTYIDDVDACAKVIASNLFRPPFGRITPSQIQVLKSKYEIIMWDITSGDFDKKISKEKCLANIINHAKAGSIVLMHDTNACQEKIKFVLPKVLEFCQENSLNCKGI